jgi:hypothetical protein
MKRLVLGVLGLLVLVVLIMQLTPVDRSNPPVSGVVAAPPEAMTVLRRACWDCHSNETAWPWYARVAPVSWIVAHDVAEGRSKLNFTTWDAYDAGTRVHKLHEVLEEIAEGEMPMPAYVSMHPEAEVSASDLAVLRDWIEGGGAWSGADGAAGQPADGNEENGEAPDDP